jgi:hypothetical protein
MADKSQYDRAGAMWWTPTSGGGLRRIWVRKSGQDYLCARELCSAEQEAARSRIFAAGEANEPQAVEDIHLWCQAHFAQMRTSSAAEAWVFLGADEMAQCALEDCDPTLDDAFVPGAPCETMEAVHKTEVRTA